MSTAKYTLYQDDCLAALKQYPNNYFDAIVTDPPSGIGFMGSGTTGVAAISLGFQFVGIDNDPVSHKTADKRIKHAARQERLL